MFQDIIFSGNVPENAASIGGAPRNRTKTVYSQRSTPLSRKYSTPANIVLLSLLGLGTNSPIIRSFYFVYLNLFTSYTRYTVEGAAYATLEAFPSENPFRASPIRVSRYDDSSELRDSRRLQGHGSEFGLFRVRKTLTKPTMITLTTQFAAASAVVALHVAFRTPVSFQGESCEVIDDLVQRYKSDPP